MILIYTYVFLVLTEIASAKPIMNTHNIGEQIIEKLDEILEGITNIEIAVKLIER